MKACAFVVHPLTPPQRRVLGARLGDRALLQGRPSDRIGEVARLVVETHRGPVRVHVVAVPDLPDALLAEQRRALDLQVRAAVLAERLGATAIGLGSALAVVAGRGAALAEHTGLRVTSGHAATAWTCATLTLGASGAEPVGVLSFGTPLGEAIAARLAPHRHVLAACTTQPAARRARALGAEPMPTADVMKGAGVLVSAAATGPTVDPAALRPGTVLIDLANPPSLAPSEVPPAAVVLAGETLAWPGRVRGGAFGDLWRLFAGYERRLAYACLAEPIAMAALDAPGWSDGRRLDPDAVGRCGEALTALGFVPRPVSRRPPG